MTASPAREAIMASFLRLLEERPLREITVKDIVRDCGVNRNTRAPPPPWRTAWRPPPASPWSTGRRCCTSTSPPTGIYSSCA